MAIFIVKIYLMKRLYILLTIILLNAGLQAQEKEILQVLHQQAKAWNNGDLKGYMNGYWKNDSLKFIGRNGITTGWEATLKNYEKGYPTKEKMGTLKFSEVQVKMLGKKHAYVIGKWELAREKDTPKGIYTLIFEKFKEGWRCISDHTN